MKHVYGLNLNFRQTRLDNDILCNVCVRELLDASAYAHFVFNAFDQDRNGSISFEVILANSVEVSYDLERALC